MQLSGIGKGEKVKHFKCFVVSYRPCSDLRCYILNVNMSNGAFVRFYRITVNVVNIK